MVPISKPKGSAWQKQVLEELPGMKSQMRVGGAEGRPGQSKGRIEQGRAVLHVSNILCPGHRTQGADAAVSAPLKNDFP